MLKLIVFLVALIISAPGAHADRRDCYLNKNINRQIQACTQIIKRGQGELKRIRAYAYNNRGNAYRNKGRPDLAKIGRAHV